MAAEQQQSRAIFKVIWRPGAPESVLPRSSRVEYIAAWPVYTQNIPAMTARLIASASYRAPSDALLIESQAKTRLADEYDAAQKRGVVAKLGSNQTEVGVPGENTLVTTAEIGLTRKEVHEARTLCDAEASLPRSLRHQPLDRDSSRASISRLHLRTSEAMRGVVLISESGADSFDQ